MIFQTDMENNLFHEGYSLSESVKIDDLVLQKRRRLSIKF